VNQTSDWVVLGRFGRPQGLKGWVRIVSFTDPEAAILGYTSWHMRQKDTWVPVSVVNTTMQNNTILAQVTDCESRDDAAKLTNIDIGVLRTDMPKLPSGEYYWHQLENMCVRNQKGIELGHVSHILPTGANEVLVVQGNKRHLIPYVPDVYIMSVDLELQQIVVDWDENF